MGLFLGALTGLAGLVAAPAARADHCKVFVDANRPVNMGGVTTLPSDVTMTFATGSPNNSSWANTSQRFTGSRMTQIGRNNNITSIEVGAQESDVSLYIFDGADFNGAGQVLYCKKGRTCFIDQLGSMNNKTSSFICQREFFRKSFFVSPTGVVQPNGSNPVIPMSRISTEVDNKVWAMLNGKEGIDNVRFSNPADPGEAQTFSRTVWMNKTDYCRTYGLACATSEPDRMVDYMRISKAFEIDLDLPVEIIPGDDDYGIQIDWYVRPVLADQFFELRFWWARTDIWVEDDIYSGRVEDEVFPAVDAVNIQTELRNGVVAAADAAGCRWCIDRKSRLQMSFFEDADVGKDVFTRMFNMTTSPAKIVLTTNRDAIY